MDPATIMALSSAAGTVGKLFGMGGGGGSSAPGQVTNVSQNNSQSQNVNVGSNPYIPELSGSTGDLLASLYGEALNVPVPSGNVLGDTRYTTTPAKALQANGGFNINQILIYTAIGLAGYFLFMKMRS